jgi:hypothetical protein
LPLPDFGSPGLSDALGTPERTDSEYSHGNGVSNGKAHDPKDRPVPPLFPGDERPIRGKYAEKGARSFMKELTRNTPDDTKGDQKRPPKGR